MGRRRVRDLDPRSLPPPRIRAAAALVVQPPCDALQGGNKMATDPVCGMTVQEKDAPVRTMYAGKNYYFCSNDCFQKFNANPRKYAKEPAEAEA